MVISQFSQEPATDLLNFLINLLGPLSCGDCCCPKGGRSAKWLSKFISKAYPCVNSDRATLEYALEWGARRGLFYRSFDNCGTTLYSVNRYCRLKNPKNGKFLNMEDEPNRPYGAVTLKCCLPPNPCGLAAPTLKRKCPKPKCCYVSKDFSKSDSTTV